MDSFFSIISTEHNEFVGEMKFMLQNSKCDNVLTKGNKRKATTTLCAFDMHLMTFALIKNEILTDQKIVE